MKTSLRTCFALLLAGALVFGYPGAVSAQDADKPIEQASYTTEGQDVLAVLESAGQYTMLIDALKKTGLARQLENAPAFTLFAPTDAAIEKSPDFKKMTTPELTSVLRGHVVMEAISSEKAMAMKAIPLADGGEAMMASQGGKTRIGEATIVAPDIKSANGVIHGIDAVLQPAKKMPDEGNRR